MTFYAHIIVVVEADTLEEATEVGEYAKERLTAELDGDEAVEEIYLDSVEV